MRTVEILIALVFVSCLGCAGPAAPIDQICELSVDICQTDATHDACVMRVDAATVGTVDPDGCVEASARCASCISSAIRRGRLSETDACGPFGPSVCPSDCATPTPNPCAPPCETQSDCGTFATCVDGRCT